MFNCNAIIVETENAMDVLKKKYCWGGVIPAAFLKHSKTIIIQDICTMLNYIIAIETFPDSWAEGIGTYIHKADVSSEPNNFRGITVLHIFERIFETIN